MGSIHTRRSGAVGSFKIGLRYGGRSGSGLGGASSLVAVTVGNVVIARAIVVIADSSGRKWCR